MRRYNVYKEIWDAVVNCENGNRVNPFTVVVVRGDTIISHVPRKVSSICSLYLCRDQMASLFAA